MIAVDLIPDNLKKHQQRRRRRRQWIVAVAAAAVVITAVSLAYYLEYLRENRILKTRQAQFQQLQQDMQQFSQAKNQLELFRDRLAVLDQLGRYGDYLKITDYLMRQSPALIYLKRMRFDRSEHSVGAEGTTKTVVPKNAAMFLLNPQAQSKTENSPPLAASPEVIMTLQGVAAHHQAVADFLGALHDSGMFQHVKLVRSSRQPVDATEVISFDIECRLSPEVSVMGVSYASVPETSRF